MEMIDERDENLRTALMLVVMGTEDDDTATFAAQTKKLEALVDAGSNICDAMPRLERLSDSRVESNARCSDPCATGLWDEDEETALSLAFHKELHDLVFIMLNSRWGGVGIRYEDRLYCPLISYTIVQEALADSSTALVQTMKAIVGAYATLSLEGAAATCCAGFTLSRQRDAFREAVYNTVSWATAAANRGRELKITDQTTSDLCMNLSNSLELALAGLLRRLARGGMNEHLYTKVGELLSYGKGMKAFERAVSG